MLSYRRFGLSIIFLSSLIFIAPVYANTPGQVSTQALQQFADYFNAHPEIHTDFSKPAKISVKNGRCVYYEDKQDQYGSWCYLAKADITNNGNPDYMLVLTEQGTGNYTAVAGMFALHGKIFKRLPYAKTVLRNLCPSGDMSKFFMNAPNIVRKQGKTYLAYANGKCVFYWHAASFTLVQGNKTCLPATQFASCRKK